MTARAEKKVEKRVENLFGTDGVRGTANLHPMTASMALRLGQAAAYVFRGRRDGGRRILIAKDTRLSGYMFEDALAAGISSMGGTVIQVGPIPTPALAFLTTDMRCDAGVMITASHNPYQDNGIKFFGSDAWRRSVWWKRPSVSRASRYAGTTVVSVVVVRVPSYGSLECAEYVSGN